METGFSDALLHLKNGERMMRSGWNGKGMWIVLVPTNKSAGAVDLGDQGLWEVSPYIGMKTADDKFVPWLASQTDLLANDWQMIVPPAKSE